MHGVTYVCPMVLHARVALATRKPGRRDVVVISRATEVRAIARLSVLSRRALPVAFRLPTLARLALLSQFYRVSSVIDGSS